MSDSQRYTYEKCVYTIVNFKTIEDALCNAGSTSFVEKKLWKTAYLQLQDANVYGAVYLVLLADAAAINGVQWYAMIEDIELRPDGTTKISISTLHTLDAIQSLTTLTLQNSGAQLSDAFIRPYALCMTPEFAEAEVMQICQRYEDVEAYKEALLKIESEMTDGQRKMLLGHYVAPDMALSVTKLAEIAGYDGSKSGSLHYGKLARKISEIIGKVPPTTDQMSAIAQWTNEKDERGHGQWLLNDEMAQALEELGWVTPPAESSVTAGIVTKELKMGGMENLQSLDHFVAYHSVKTMGKRFNSQNELSFYSNKPKSILDKSIGNVVWVIEGNPTKGKTTFNLCSAYISTKVVVQVDGDFKFNIKGRRIFNNDGSVHLSQCDWFDALHHQTGHFSLGFVKIKDNLIIDGLCKIACANTVLSTVKDTFYGLVVSSYNDNEHERRKRLAEANKIPKQIHITTTAFVRNPDVVAEVLHRAKGLCELCTLPAPFKRKVDNSPYLEVHHQIRLADGGLDCVENAVALCPNCHRKNHHGMMDHM